MTKLLFILTILLSCNSVPTSTVAVEQTQSNAANTTMLTDSIVPPTYAEDGTLERIEKTAEEWKKELTEQEFYVLRESGTERSFTGDLWDNKKAGTYTCAGCALPLFSSDTKFKSGTGWPSFYQPIKPEYIEEKADRSHGMVRVEVLCGRCGGHQGHVFNDGPKPTGLRYCINSVSMNFVPSEEK